jgi:hypothetical protein
MQVFMAKEAVKMGVIIGVRLRYCGEGWIIEINLHGTDIIQIIELQRGGARIFRTLDSAMKMIDRIGYLSEIKIMA